MDQYMRVAEPPYWGSPESSDGGGPERWDCACYFDGLIDDLVMDQVLAINALIGFATSQSESNTFMTIGVYGQMDEAVASAVQTLKPLVGALITNQLTEVHITSHADAARQLEDGLPIRGFDVTQSVKAALGLV